METQLGPGESALSCCSGLQHNTHTAFTQTNDGVMIYHCWALRWTTATDSQRSSSYLLALLWRPCSPDRVVLEGGPPSSLSSFIVDWRPGHKHNYILFLRSFSSCFYTAFIKPPYCRSQGAVVCLCLLWTRGRVVFPRCRFIDPLILNKGKDVEMLPRRF